MKNKRLLKTIVGLAIAFAMTFTPFSGSYAMLVNPAGNGDGQVTETQATDATSEDAVSEETEPSQPEVTTEESEPAEQAEPEIEENVEPVEEVAEKAERTEYIWKDEKVKVTAVLSDAEAIPDDAELVAKAVTSKSDDYDYDAYMEALNKNSDSKYNGKNTLLYDVAFMKDGVEIQPESGTVSVTFEFLDKQLSKSIGAKKASDVNVIHLPLKNKIRDKYDTTADAKNIDAKDIVFEELTKKDNELAVSVKNEKVQFETSEFSVYAYTVDFEYTDPETGKVYTYNLEGAGSITIKELAIILGITTKADADEFVDNVENVKFSDENLVKVKKTLFRGWVLKSLAPFSSEELLTITMKDGTVIEVKVTDNQISSDLTNFLTNAVITGAAQKPDGTYVVEKGKDYSIILSFAESSAYQFDNAANLTYQMPRGITIITEQNGSMKINIVYKGRTYQVDATYRLTTDGKLTIKFKEDDPDYEILTESTNVSFRFTYNAQFDGTSTDIPFSDEVERDVEFDEPEPGQAFANKTATYDEKTGKFTYTIKVTATGDVKDVNVKDKITGDALIFNNDVTVSPSSAQYTDNHASNGFDYTFASMAEGETITITYSANVDFTKGKDGKITADQTKNTVTVDPDPGDPHNSEYSREINYKYADKGNGTEVGTTENGDKIIEWTIDYNELALVKAGGDTITDRIGGTSASYMKYYGDGIKVDVYDRSGNLKRTDNINYNQLTEFFNTDTDAHWKYTIPTTDTTPYRYHITYRTVVDMKKINSGTGTAVTLNNTSNDDSESIVVGPDNEITVNKAVETFNTEEVTWVSTITVPEAGLSQAVVTDTFPHIYLDGNLYDVFKDGSLDIQGLLPGESYKTAVSGSNLVITFYKDTAQSETGLQRTTGGHTITIRLTTKVNQEWLQKGYKAGEYEKKHVNTIDFNGKTAQALVVFDKPGIEKTGAEDVNQKGRFLYTIKLIGVTDTPISVKDTFDTSLLEVDTSMANQGPYGDHMRIRGGINGPISGRVDVNYSDVSDGIMLTADNLPVQADGNYYPYYWITYYLKLKDGVDLEQLAIANGGEHHLINKAIWAGHETEFDYKTEYDYLDKKLLNAGQIGGTNRTAKYRITFNKAKATLNKGEPMEMKDVLSDNLSLDYSSVKITTNPAGAQVPYSISGGKDEQGNPDGTTVATYIIPDSTEVVIEYNAEVRGNGTQKIKNKVTINGREETSIDEKDYGSASEGEGAVASFKIVKVDGYDANKKLEGVKFKIFAENPNIDFGEKVNHVKEIVLTTDKNGEIILDGANYEFYFNEVYHVREIEPLEDYGNIGFDYLVTLTNDMAHVDYGHYIYYYSDTMQIKNWPLEGLVVEKQVDSDNPSDHSRFYNFRVSILNEDGTVNTGYNEKNGDDQFVNGVVTFKLKDTEQKMFWGFKKGTKYKVEELDADGFATEVTYSIFDEDGKIIDTITAPGISHEGELTQEDEVIVFKNSKHEKGSLKIKKNVTVNGEATTGTEADGDYEFTITGPGGYSETKTIKITNGVSNEVQVDDLVPGEYTITEKTPKNGTSLIGENGKKVTVTANNTANIPTAVFKNNLAKGEGEIKVQKVLNGREWTDTDRFTFTLSAADGTPMPGTTEITITKADADQTKSFGKIRFTEAGKYTYTVKETTTSGNGIICDNTDHTVTIEVVDDGNGNLVAKEGTQLIKTEKITNTYEAEGKGEIKVQKVLDGREWTDNDRFTFTLTGVSAPEGISPVPMPGTTEITITKADADQIKSFGEIKFTKAGTYTYKVKETTTSGNGIICDNTDHTVTIKVKDNGDGTLVADGTPLIQTEKITNTYSAEGEGEIKVQKVLNGREWTDDDQFTFTIKAAEDSEEDTPLPGAKSITIKKADADQIKSFGKIRFTKAGTYKYVVNETKGTIQGVTYDDSDHIVTIKVKDNGDGTLVADGTPLIQTEKVTNTYGAEGEGEIKVQKVLNGREWTDDDQFTFTLTGESAPEGISPVPMPGETSITIKKADADQIKSFGKIKFKKAGTYTYIVKETTTSGDGVVCDNKEHKVTIKVVDDGNGNLIADTDSSLIQTEKITNTYEAKGEGEIKVKKTLIGREWTNDDQFTFTLSAADGTPMPKNNSITIKKTDTDQTKSFGTIEFTKEGTYTYTVKETTTSGKGITCDNTDHTVTIKVKDNGKGALVADGTPLVQTKEIINTYEAKGKGEVKVKKNLVGRAWTTNDSFEFTITPVDGAPAFTPSTLTITSADAPDYTKSFGEVTFTKEGTYEWIVSETHKGETIKGVTYESADKTITMVVKDDGEGNLIAKDGSALIQTAKFENTYDAKGSIPLSGTKKFKNGLLNKEAFTFSVYKEADFNVAIKPTPLSPERARNDQNVFNDLQGKAVLTATTSGAPVDADGNALFDFKTADGKDLEYTLADISISEGGKIVDGHLTKDFSYVVVEDIPAGAVKKTVNGVTFYYDSVNDIKYDATVYNVTITVTDKGDGTLDVKTSDEVVKYGFVNEKIYTRLLLTKNIDSLVTGDTEGELTNVTCVFKVSYTDPILGRTVSRTVSVQFDAKKVSAETALVDKIPIDATDLRVDEVYSVDYTGEVKQGVAIRGVDQDTGLPLWTATFDNKRKGDITGSGVINKVEKNGNTDTFVITNRRDSTGKNPSPPGNADDNQAPQGEN